MKKLLIPVIVALLSSVFTLAGAFVFIKKTINKKGTTTVVISKTSTDSHKSHSKNNTVETDNSIDSNLSARIKSKLPDFAPLVEKLKPTVVHIATTSGRGNPYLLKRYHGMKDHGSLGTGILISSDGLILTNYHVIRGAARITVKLSNGKTYPAFLKGRDDLTDIALIKIKGKNLPVAPFGNSETLNIGAWVIAIGNPFGLSNTVTAGIISAKNRTDLNPGKLDYSNYIQTDTAINPGNSGGPLINLRGEVIGINTLVDTRGQGIGYAIPINRIKKIIPHLAKWGKVERSFLGVKVMAVDAKTIRRTKFPKREGAYIDSITPNGPAHDAGLKVGDIIIKFNGKPIKDEQDIAWEASMTGIGNVVKVKVYRDYKFRTFDVKMVGHPDNRITTNKTKDGKTPFGVFVKDVKGMGFKTNVVIVKVLQGSIGYKYGLRRGDRILNIGRTPIKNARDYYKTLSLFHNGQNIMLLIDSPNTTRWVVLPLK
jgi:serine protease Do